MYIHNTYIYIYIYMFLCRALLYLALPLGGQACNPMPLSAKLLDPTPVFSTKAGLGESKQDSAGQCGAAGQYACQLVCLIRLSVLRPCLWHNTLNQLISLNVNKQYIKPTNVMHEIKQKKLTSITITTTSCCEAQYMQQYMAQQHMAAQAPERPPRSEPRSAKQQTHNT